ncbi:coilin [Hibiscus trionum]|uniref:Coilin n=1 Tax=Hibiscus trionum TaxID=183268 RepID=A0A9W7H497_HIBTR|nr:coilin [Hibiscus trionum]
METARLRLVFEDPNILSKSQKKQGLKRSWFLLKPQHQTISDLTSDLLHIFDLRESCPNGLILCMDGFALPPFESTCIFKDKDIVSVKKKGRKSTEIIEAGDDLNFSEEFQIIAEEEVGKEAGGYESESEEDERELVPLETQIQVESTPIKNMVSKKRKARDKLPSSRKKKSKLASAEKSPVPGDDEIDIRPKKRKSSRKRKVVEKDKPDDIQGEPDNSSSPEIDGSSDDQTNLGRSSNLQNTGKGSDDEPMSTTEVKKLPSRSARRKKAKRLWLREQAKIEKEKLNGKDDQQSPAKENVKFSEDRRQPISNDDVGDNVVPIIVRPGHIRFEPLEEEDAEQAVQQSKIPVNTFQWNGITSKKKGQKWGTEKVPCMKWNDNSFSQVSSEMVDVNKNATVTDDMDFDKLTPYSSSPKEGDLVAYRLVELSSTWTPELCSFRVGEISHYDAGSNMIKLTPVPGYPNASEKKIDQEDSDSELPDTSLYREDGSLEIDYSSLVDVRLVKHGNPNTTKAIADGSNENSAQDQDVLTRQPSGSKEAVTVSAAPPAQANGAVNVWDEINEALSAKKAELSKEDGWSRADSSGRSAWSYRALRRSALGPTMAFLRAQNGI